MRQKKSGRALRGRIEIGETFVSVAFDGLDYARHWTCRFQTASHLLEDNVRVFLLWLRRSFADNLDNFIAAILELLEQIRNRFGGGLLEVVHQNDALAVLLQLFHYRGDYLLRLAHLEVERIHVGGENAEIAFAHIFQQLRRMA